MGWGSSVVTAVAQVQCLYQGHPLAPCTANQKKNKQTNKQKTKQKKEVCGGKEIKCYWCKMILFLQIHKSPIYQGYKIN